MIVSRWRLYSVGSGGIFMVAAEGMIKLARTCSYSEYVRATNSSPQVGDCVEYGEGGILGYKLLGLSLDQG